MEKPKHKKIATLQNTFLSAVNDKQKRIDAQSWRENNFRDYSFYNNFLTQFIQKPLILFHMTEKSCNHHSPQKGRQPNCFFVCLFPFRNMLQIINFWRLVREILIRVEQLNSTNMYGTHLKSKLMTAWNYSYKYSIED